MSHHPGSTHRVRRSRAGLAVLMLLALWPAGSTLAEEKTGNGDVGSSNGEVAAVSFEQESAQLRALAQEWAARAAEYEQARDEAPERLAAIELEIARLLAADGAALEVEESDLQELEARIDLEEQQLVRARQESAALDAEASKRAERRKRIPELRTAASERLLALDQENPPASASATTEGADQGGSAQLAQLRRAVLESEIAAYQNELGSYDARGQLLAKRRDLASVKIEALESRIAQLREAAKAMQRLAAQREVEEARAVIGLAVGLPAEVRQRVGELASANEDLARRRIGDGGIVQQIDESTLKLERVREQITRVEADLADLIEKIEAGGLTDSVGLLLREHRSNAPDIGKYRRFIRMDEEIIASVQIDQIGLRDRRRALANVDKRADEALLQLGDAVSPGERARTLSLLRLIFETERNYTDALIEDLDDYFQKLVDLDAAQRTLIDRTDQLVQFIDERILWVPSGSPIGSATPRDAVDGLAWLFASRYWEQIARVIRDVAFSSPFTNLLALVGLVVGIGAAGRARREIRALGELSRKQDCADFTPTWKSLGLTLWLTAWTPGVLAYFAWRVASSPDAAQYARSVAHGLLAVSLVWITLRLPRQVLRRGGLAEAHFGWSAGPVGGTRAQLLWLTSLAVPTTFLIYTFQMRGDEAWNESAGRIAFVAVMLALAVFARLTFRAEHGIAAAVAAANGWRSGRWPWRLAHAASVAIPLLLAIAELRGYYWTALQLAARTHMTIVFLFALFLIVEMSARWSLIAGRLVARETARGFGAASDGADGGDFMDPPTGSSANEPARTPRASDPIDLATVRAQTSRLTTSATLFLAVVGVWVIWVDVLPAAGMLREIELWTTTRDVSVAMLDANGVEHLSTQPQLVPITLANLVFALLIGLVSFAMVRNLPGLLEISLLRRFSAGERYAYTTIAKYAVTIAGIAFTFDAIGVGWSNIQWLVAAVGLGLGFGLQEIFANFVSGLIILFERPIRVGDTVTVGDLSGTVSKIRIRATWITGFDRKEMVVPNKEFVTTRLINWSLTDQTLRVDIKVGIAYGSDTERAIEVLRRVAGENPHILASPEVQVLFLGFGDSSLDFELRVFSPDVSHLMPIRHGLHMAIDRAFRAEGIEIAFPQRDLHLRSVPETWRGAATGEPEKGPTA